MDKVCWFLYLWWCQSPSLGGSAFCEREAPAKGAETWLPQREALSTNSPAAPGAGRSSILLSNLDYYMLAVSLLLHIPWDTLAIDTFVVASSVKTSFAPGSAARAPHSSPCFPSTPSISTPFPRTLYVLTVMSHCAHSHYSHNPLPQHAWRTAWWSLLRISISCHPKSLSMYQFSRSVMSDSLWPRGLQHARLPCLSPTPGVCSNSCALSRWCHPTISSSVVPFFFSLQSFPASESFPVSQFFISGDQSMYTMLKYMYVYTVLKITVRDDGSTQKASCSSITTQFCFLWSSFQSPQQRQSFPFSSWELLLA